MSHHPSVWPRGLAAAIEVAALTLGLAPAALAHSNDNVETRRQLGHVLFKT